MDLKGLTFSDVHQFLAIVCFERAGHGRSEPGSITRPKPRPPSPSDLDGSITQFPL